MIIIDSDEEDQSTVERRNEKELANESHKVDSSQIIEILKFKDYMDLSAGQKLRILRFWCDEIMTTSSFRFALIPTSE